MCRLRRRFRSNRSSFEAARHGSADDDCCGQHITAETGVIDTTTHSRVSLCRCSAPPPPTSRRPPAKLLPWPGAGSIRWETLAAVLGAVIIAVAAAVLQPLSFRQPARPSPSRTRSPGRVERAQRMRTAQHTALMAPAAGQLPRLRRRRCPRRRPALRHVGQGPRRAHVHRGCAHCA